MENSINFISTQTQRKIRLKRVLRLATMALSIVLTTSLLVYCVSIPVVIALKAKIHTVDTQIESIKAQVDQNRQLESMVQTIVSRSSLVADVTDRTNRWIEGYLDLIILLSENGYRLKSNLEVKKAGEVVEVEGEVPSAPALLEISRFLDDLSAREFITTYNVGTIQRSETGSYKVTVTLN